MVLIVACHSYYPLSYIYRVLVWQESDYDDYLKFNSAHINSAESAFQFAAANTEKSATELSKLAQYIEEDDFIHFLKKRGTYAFLLIRNDSILVEEYFEHSNRQTLQNTFSVSKSILSLAIIKAIELGHIENIDEPITKYIPELLERDSAFGKIRIGDLLRMKSGINYSDDMTFPLVNCDNVLTYYHPDLRKVALKKTRIGTQPNHEFLYNNYNPLLIGLILERATTMRLSSFMEEYIWTKIGTSYPAIWSTDENDFEKMESGFMASPIDMAKVGRLLLTNGEYKGREIISKQKLAEFTYPVSKIEMPEDQLWGYSHFWWSLPDGTANPPIFANGHMGQFIYVNPKTKCIIIRNGLRQGDFYDDYWTKIFNDYCRHN